MEMAHIDLLSLLDVGWWLKGSTWVSETKGVATPQTVTTLRDQPSPRKHSFIAFRMYNLTASAEACYPAPSYTWSLYQ